MLYEKSGLIESIYDSSVSYCGIIGYWVSNLLK